MIITSPQNPSIKLIAKLSKESVRRENHLFVLEGAREMTLAIAGGYKVKQVFYCEKLLKSGDYPDLLSQFPRSMLVEITEQIFEKIAYRKHSDGVIALIEPKEHGLEQLKKDEENPFYIILESVEKPGNLGAILRTADAARASGIIVCNKRTDIYNPNVLRSSIGTVFTVPIAITTSEEALKWLNENNVEVFATSLQSSSYYQHCDFTKPCAIAFGTESDGLSEFWINNSSNRIKIPMRGVIDSLNVSVSVAILTFETMRQRGF